MTLYVDCDDTMVTWLGPNAGDGPHPYGYGADRWEPNVAVLRYVEQAHARGQDIVVWSGGGQDYAAEWGRKLLPHIPHVALSKFNAIARDGDVFLDDMPFAAWAHATIHPRELPQ